MSLVTSCPACDTTFLVTPEQLSAHRGDVRCGQCQHIFNALQKLEEVSPLVSLPLSQSVSGQVEKATENFEQTQILQPAQAALLEPHQAEIVADEGRPDGVVSVDGTVDFELEFSGEETAESIPESETALAESLVDIEVVTEPIQPELDAETPPIFVVTPEPELTVSAPGFLQPESKRGTSLWLLVPLATLLLVGVLGQTAYFFRIEIAAHYPRLRPWLEQACSRLACTVELPRQADLLNIEDSDLQDDADHAGALLLVSALYNRAPYPQAYPLLELTLTDTYDQPVLRRTFAPLEYLPAGTDVRAGIAASGEVHSRMHLSIEGDKPAGYRLYVKY